VLFSVSLVENIRFLCKLHGTTIPKLGAELGFGKGAIYNWDTNSPSVDKVEKVAAYFGVSINKVLYGFDANEFTNLTNIARGERTIVQFAEETGVDHNELLKICLGLGYEKPSIETVKKIASKNAHNWLFDEEKLLEAAGYVSEQKIKSSKMKIFNELVEYYKNFGLYAVMRDGFDEVHISTQSGNWHKVIDLDEFLENGFDLLERFTSELRSSNAVQTIAAHHEGEDWTEEELEEIERFKEFVRMKRQQKKQE
jgi:hypothetical protein